MRTRRRPAPTGRMRRVTPSSSVRSLLALLLLSLAWLSSPRTAAAHGSGVLLFSDGSRVLVGSYTFENASGGVARGAWAQIVAGQFHRSEFPGFNAVGTGLPAPYLPLGGQVDVGFALVPIPGLESNIGYWDGEGAASFGPVPAGERVLVQRGTGSGFVTAVAEGTDTVVPGFTLFRTNSGFVTHAHVDFFLLGAKGTGVAPSDAIYLIAMVPQVAGLQDGEIVFLLYGKGAGQGAMDAALSWVDTWLVPDCSDRADNDGDGLRDFGLDPDCASADQLIETPLTDGDEDGVPDFFDNCTLAPNPDQTDTDEDGFGNRCDADFDQSGAVNFADLARLRAGFFGAEALLDLTGDGVVNFADLALVRSMFLAAPGPSGVVP